MYRLARIQHGACAMLRWRDSSTSVPSSRINVCLALSIIVTSCTTKNMLLFYNKEKDYDRSKGMGCCFVHFSLNLNKKESAMNAEEETIVVRTGENFDLQKVERYLRDHIEGIGEGSLHVRQFPTGASNLTYLLQIGVWEGVLRRPPLGPVPPKAHDMKRECTLLQTIHPVFSLAPLPYIFCDDLTILGAPFYVMERRKRVVLNTSFPAGVIPTTDLCSRLPQTFI